MEKIDFNKAIRQHGLKSTKIRLSVLDILFKSEQPLDAEQVFLALKAWNVSANLSTVYRVLEVLAEKNLIAGLALPGTHRTVYALKQQDHWHYLVCLGCKKMIAVDGCPLSGYEHQLEQQTGYLISTHQLDLYGYCPTCQQKNLPRGQ
ncbi:MAG: Fur family transcriptional regulator [Candidatus Fimivivens sp.]|nr:Fur family transcriptional regulator [Candidatus Fimivivens sp.]